MKSKFMDSFYSSSKHNFIIYHLGLYLPSYLEFHSEQIGQAFHYLIKILPIAVYFNISRKPIVMVLQYLQTFSEY